MSMSYSVTKSCLILYHPIDCTTPGFPVHHLPESTQTHVHQVSDATQPSHPLLAPFSSCPQSFPASGSFPVSQLLASCGQSIRASAAASVLPMNIQGWFPLGLTDLISLQSKGPSIRPQYICHNLGTNIDTVLLTQLWILFRFHQVWFGSFISVLLVSGSNSDTTFSSIILSS